MSAITGICVLLAFVVSYTIGYVWVGPRLNRRRR